MPEDWLREEGVFPGAISPDGQILVYSRIPPLADRVQQFGDTVGRKLSDLLLVTAVHEAGDPITTSLKSGMGYAYPRWSPDGTHLAAVALQGSRARIEVWDRRSIKWSVLTDWFIPPLQATSWVVPEYLQWIDDAHILWVEQRLPFTPADGRLSVEQQEAIHGWTEKGEGRVSASILTTGTNLPGRPRRFNLSNVVAHTTVNLIEGEFLDAELSPDHAWLVAVEKAGFARPDTRPLPALAELRTVLKVVPIKKPGRASPVPGSEFAFVRSVKWSPDSSRFSFSSANGFSGKPPGTYVYRLGESGPDKVLDGLPGGAKYDPQPPNWIADSGHARMFWTRDNRLLMYTTGAAGAGSQVGPGWHVLAEDKSWREITAGLEAVSPMAYRDVQGDGMICLAGGRLWKIAIPGLPVLLVPRFDKRIAGVLPLESRGGFETGDNPVLGDSIVVSAADGSGQQSYVVDLSTGESRLIARPEASSLVSVNLRTGAAFFRKTDPDGAQNLYARRTFSEPARLLATANTWKKSIEMPERRLIAYKAIDGHPLQAILTLPPHYTVDHPRPMVVLVYPGSEFRSLTRDPTLDFDFPFNPMVLASHGYAVLQPSMPSDITDFSKDVSDELLNGLMPAIDKLIQDGIADGNRLGLIGHSFGGFAVFSLITQTSRFKAAISISGISDFLSIYGTFRAPDRYAEGTNLVAQSYAETSQAKFGAPPWKDPQKYLRNSPLFAVERVKTPLLIVEGDWDFVGLQQGEEFFSALMRLNKPARFVRYWGEGHNILSAGNMIHAAHEFYDWFDRYLGL